MISISTSKSGSNWLDRLRTSRGFPTAAEPDLDRFLASSSSSAGSTQPGPSTRTESTHSIPRAAKISGASLAGKVSDVLCDLFNMPGESSRTFSGIHKTGRKQSNPKCFNGGSLISVKKNNGNNGNELCSSDDLRREKSDNAVASSGDNSLTDKNATNINNARKKRSGSDKDKVAVAAVGNGVDDEDDIDVKEFTRSEVTVIDTSTKDWKSDKWVFRKKESDEWRVKDKKRGGKKRKCDDDDENDQMLIKNNGGKEKEKVKILHLNQLHSHNDNEGEPLKEPSHLVSKVPHSRFPCPRPPEKPRSVGSSVILLKPVPLSNNTNVITKLGKSIHKKKPKKMKLI